MKNTLQELNKNMLIYKITSLDNTAVRVAIFFIRLYLRHWGTNPTTCIYQGTPMSLFQS